MFTIIKAKSSCRRQRRNAIFNMVTEKDYAVYIPQCSSAGDFKEIQCHGSMCWCIDENGQHVGYDRQLSKVCQSKRSGGKFSIVSQMELKLQ